MAYRTLTVFAAIAFFAIGSSADARFMQTDPVGYQDDINVYLYTHDDPTDLTDPTGKDTFGCVVTDKGQIVLCTNLTTHQPLSPEELARVAPTLHPASESEQGKPADGQKPEAANGEKPAPAAQPTQPKPREKAQDRRAREQAERERQRGGEPDSGKGTPGDNQRQNRAFDDATRGLTEEQKRRLHDEITGRDLL